MAAVKSATCCIPYLQKFALRWIENKEKKRAAGYGAPATRCRGARSLDQPQPQCARRIRARPSVKHLCLLRIVAIINQALPKKSLPHNEVKPKQTTLTPTISQTVRTMRTVRTWPNDNISANPPMQARLNHTDSQNTILAATQASRYTIVTKSEVVC